MNKLKGKGGILLFSDANVIAVPTEILLELAITSIFISLFSHR